MEAPFTRPSTRKGLKRFAKRIGRELGVPHLEALGRASVIAGFQNYEHARRNLAAPDDARSDRSGPMLFLTAYWRDPPTGDAGRETLRLALPTPWHAAISTREFQHHRKLSELSRVADDHLQIRNVVRGQEAAHRMLRGAADIFAFAAATGLRPARMVVRSHQQQEHYELPGRDHSSYWQAGDPSRWVLVDEPYPHAAEGKRDARDAWARAHGYTLLRTTWGGLHAPGMTAFEMVTRDGNGVDLARIAAALDALPWVADDAPWDGESGPYRPLWRSPDQEAAAAPAARAPRDGSARRRAAGSVGYGGFLAARDARRPDARMPIAAHQEAAELIGRVLALMSAKARVRAPVERLRCLLDDWVQREHDRTQMSSEIFNALYYGQTDREPVRRPTPAQLSEALRCVERLGALLTQHYPESKPRRQALRCVELAGKWIRPAVDAV